MRIPEAAPPKPCGCVARWVYVPAAGSNSHVWSCAGEMLPVLYPPTR